MPTFPHRSNYISDHVENDVFYMGWYTVHIGEITPAVNINAKIELLDVLSMWSVSY
jgi:hypothetical protein